MQSALPMMRARRAALTALLLTAIALALLALPLTAPAADNLGCATAPVTADPTATVCLANQVIIFDGVSPDNQFVVSWRTLKNESGQVKFTTGETFDDIRGADYSGKTHYIVVSNLDARTKYNFDIVAGGKLVTNNNAHWNVRTGPAISPGTPYNIFGRVSNPDGSEADGTIIYAQVRNGDNQGTQGRSAWLSALVVVPDGGNFFNLNLESARTNNNVQKYGFVPESDRVFILASGSQGLASKAFTISELHPPAPPPSLILAGSGSGSAVTATPTLIPPTHTPTLSPTTTHTATPVSPTPTHTPTNIPPSETPEAITKTAQAEATQADERATQTEQAAATETIAVETTSIAMPAGEQAEPQRTRIYEGVPEFAPAPTNNSISLWVILAIVLIVGAILLGAAALLISRSKIKRQPFYRP